MRPFTVDANAIALFQQERISARPGEGIAAISAITAQNHIALDVEKLCLQEWMNSAEGKLPFALSDWINDMMAVGKIKLYKLSENSCRKKLLNFGLPKDDHKWVRLALGSEGRIIVSGDVDFLEPKQKRANKEVKDKIRSSGKGSCAKSLNKEFDVEVIDTAAVPAYLS